jgi:hypothetical protein
MGIKFVNLQGIANRGRLKEFFLNEMRDVR